MEAVFPIIILVAAILFGFTVAGVVGFGGGLIIIPAMVWVLGPKEAVPTLAITQTIAIITRFWLNRKEVDWPVVRWVSIGAVPVTLLSSILFVIVPSEILTRTIGALLIILVAQEHTGLREKLKIKLRGFTLVGALSGFVNGFVGVGGGMVAPFFLSYGLRGARYVGTFAVISLFMQGVKLAIFGSAALMGPRVVTLGLALGILGFAGSYLGQRLMGRLPERAFGLVVEVVLVVSGVLLLVKG